MESKDQCQKFNIKNCTCFYFDDMVKVVDIDFDKISLDEKSYKT